MKRHLIFTSFTQATRAACLASVVTLAFTACELREGPPAADAQPAGLVAFSVREPSGAPATPDTTRDGMPAGVSRNAALALQDAAYVLVTLRSDQDEQLAGWQVRQIEAHIFGSELITAPLPLTPGSYRVAHFAVYDRQGTAILATPTVDSERSHLVERPLPLPLQVAVDATTTITPEVIPVQGVTPAGFGYASFLSEVAPSIAFQLVAMVWQEDTGSFGYTDATLTVGHLGLPERTQLLEAATTLVEVRDLGDGAEYSLTVTKAGYQTRARIQTGAQLRAYAETPLVLVLNRLPPAQDDACSDPLPLALGVGEVGGSTSSAANHHVGSCQVVSGPEVVYEVEIPEAGRYEFNATGFDAVLYLRAVCQDESSEIACVQEGGPSPSAGLVADLSSGTYFLFVDGYQGQSGDLGVTLERLCPPGTLFDPATQACVVDPCAPNPCITANKEVCVAHPPDGYACLCNPGFVVDPDNPEMCIAMSGGEGGPCASPIEIVTAGGVLEFRETAYPDNIRVIELRQDLCFAM